MILYSYMPSPEQRRSNWKTTSALALGLTTTLPACSGEQVKDIAIVSAAVALGVAAALVDDGSGSYNNGVVYRDNIPVRREVAGENNKRYATNSGSKQRFDASAARHEDELNGVPERWALCNGKTTTNYNEYMNDMKTKHIAACKSTS